MTSNFEFMNRYWPVLYQIGSASESYLYSDPNACIYKLGQIGELVAQEIARMENITLPYQKDTQYDLIRRLSQEGLLTGDMDTVLETLRKSRNAAVHQNLNDLTKAKSLLRMTYRLAGWFVEVYLDPGFITPEYAEPKREEPIDWESMLDDKRRALESSQAEQQSAITDRDAIIAEKEKLIAQLLDQINHGASAETETTREERQQRAEEASARMGLTEAETRMLIDAQLREAGWEADTENIRYGKGARPKKGHHMAIAEWPVKALGPGTDRADYALFIGLQLVGIIEAKRAAKDVGSPACVKCETSPKRFIRNDA